MKYLVLTLCLFSLNCFGLSIDGVKTNANQNLGYQTYTTSINTNYLVVTNAGTTEFNGTYVSIPGGYYTNLNGNGRFFDIVFTATTNWFMMYDATSYYRSVYSNVTSIYSNYGTFFGTTPFPSVNYLIVTNYTGLQIRVY